MRYLLPLLLFSGCASAYVKPCATNPTVILGDSNFVNTLCHEMGAVTDNGKPLDIEDRVAGCADEWHVVTIEDKEVLYHEFKHHWKAKCSIDEQ